MKLFSWGNDSILEINKKEVFLIKEFKDLADPKRNRCKGDSTGKELRKMYKELTFIYLVYDWQSPYKEMSMMERAKEAMVDCDLTLSEVKDPLVGAAVKKYLKLQETLTMKLLKDARKAIEKIRVHFAELNLDEKDKNERPVYTAKDTIANISSLGGLVKGLKALEDLVMQEQEEGEVLLRGESELGFLDQINNDLQIK